MFQALHSGRLRLYAQKQTFYLISPWGSVTEKTGLRFWRQIDSDAAADEDDDDDVVEEVERSKGNKKKRWERN